MIQEINAYQPNRLSHWRNRIVGVVFIERADLGRLEKNA